MPDQAGRRATPCTNPNGHLRFERDGECVDCGTPPPQYVLVYTERSDDGPSLIGPFPSREAARAHADTIVIDYSESHVEALVRP